MLKPLAAILIIVIALVCSLIMKVQERATMEIKNKILKSINVNMPNHEAIKEQEIKKHKRVLKRLKGV